MKLKSAVVCCGFQKCATTSFWSHLVSSDSYSFFSVKERDYFLFEKDTSIKSIVADTFFQYRTKTFLDVSPQYACKKAAENIFNAGFENVKAVFICRNPIDRITSQMQQNIRRGSTLALELDRLTSELLDLTDKYKSSINVPIVNDIDYKRINNSLVRNSCYTGVVTYYRNLFGESNVKVYDMEDILSGNISVYRDLGVNAAEPGFPQKNTGGVSRFRLLDVISKMGPIKRFVRLVVGKRYYNIIWWWVKTELLIDGNQKIEVRLPKATLKSLQLFFDKEISS